MALLVNNETNTDINFQALFELVVEKTMIILNKKNNFDLSISLIDDESIKNLNQKYRNLNESTDVISFAMLDNEDLLNVDNSSLDLGDIFISVETAKRQAKTLNQSLKREILFLFVHGLLHLLGYDHQDLDSEKEMFKLQEEILNEVIKSNFSKI